MIGGPRLSSPPSYAIASRRITDPPFCLVEAMGRVVRLVRLVLFDPLLPLQADTTEGLTMATATKTKAALKAKTLMANLTVNDLKRSTTFFEGLGFAVDEQWEDEGKVLGVMLGAG